LQRNRLRASFLQQRLSRSRQGFQEPETPQKPKKSVKKGKKPRKTAKNLWKHALLPLTMSAKSRKVDGGGLFQSRMDTGFPALSSQGIWTCGEREPAATRYQQGSGKAE
jgi:hypothetical protein